MRRIVFLFLAGCVGLVVYLGWRPLKRQLRMMRMERDPGSYVAE